MSTLTQRIRALRERLGYTQAEFAQRCGVDQGAVARWEKGRLRPGGKAFVAMAREAGEPEKWFWLEQIGLKKSDLGRMVPPSDQEYVPLMEDSAAAGIGREIRDLAIAEQLPLPRDWVPRGATLTALKIKGESMAPIIRTGFIVLVDLGQRDPAHLINKMVAAREESGVTIKWLRKPGDLYQLVPEHPSRDNPVRILTEDKGIQIIGRVLRWVGTPEDE